MKMVNHKGERSGTEASSQTSDGTRPAKKLILYF